MFSVQNNIKYLFFLVVTISLMNILSGCDNILTQEPNYVLSASSFYSSPAEINQGVLGAYAMLQTVYEDKWRFTELRSDNTITQYNDANRGQHPTWYIDQFVVTPANIALEPYWREVYQGIQRCNAILNQIDEVKFDNKEKKKQFIGETKFLRSFYYFDLIRLFGKIPLVLTQTRSVKEAFDNAKKRASVEKVYSQIIKDAKAAVDLLPDRYSSDNRGRATKQAAHTLLGIIYLTKHKYSKAISAFKKVINSGYYALNSSYTDIFDPKSKNNKELIFGVHYAALSSNKTLGSHFIYYFAPWNSGSKITGDNAHNPDGLNIPTHSIFNAYEAGDKRKNASIGYFVDPDNRQFGIAKGDTIFYIKKFDHPHSVRGTTDDDWPVYRYAQVLLLMAEAINEVKGPTGKAYGYINRVRHRAGLNSLTPGLSQSEFRKAVYHEMRVELAFENHRWFNLLRTGRALKVMKAHAEKVRNIQPYLVEPVYQIKKYKLAYPIPSRLITLNPDIQQNPGY